MYLDVFKLFFVVYLATSLKCNGEVRRSATIIPFFRTGRSADAPVAPDQEDARRSHTKSPKHTGLYKYFRSERSLEPSIVVDAGTEDSKRSATIIPFFRTGRASEAPLSFDPYDVRVPLASYQFGENYWSPADYRTMQKKDNQNTQTKNLGMWFGPRLGRIQKRIPVRYLYFGEYTPRLGRESGEMTDPQKNDEQFSMDTAQL